MQTDITTASQTAHDLDRHAKTRSIVWDVPVRLFHWSLVILVGTTLITGFLAPEWWLDIHIWAGYGIGLLIALRILWGFYGSTYARFSNFLFPVRETLTFLRQLAKGRPAHYTGHNPAGALMVFALLAVLGALTISGLIVLGGQEKQGVLAGLISFSFGKAMAKWHELLAFLVLSMIVAHILGVFLESVLAKENLIRAMITGRKKKLPLETARPILHAAPDQIYLSISVIIIAAILAVGSVMWIKPRGLTPMPINTSYSTECGDCHHAYHPSLLPEKSWNLIMAGLSDHFGEDASLDESTTNELTAYLKTYAAERWDSEAANNLRWTSRSEPLSISASPYWVRRHQDIEKTVFVQKTVGSKGNCIACHKDASSGRFDDQKIDIPKK